MFDLTWDPQKPFEIIFGDTPRHYNPSHGWEDITTCLFCLAFITRCICGYNYFIPDVRRHLARLGRTLLPRIGDCIGCEGGCTRCGSTSTSGSFLTVWVQGPRAMSRCPGHRSANDSKLKAAVRTFLHLLINRGPANTTSSPLRLEADKAGKRKLLASYLSRYPEESSKFDAAGKCHFQSNDPSDYS
jgi:hypothetical protein